MTITRRGFIAGVSMLACSPVIASAQPVVPPFPVVKKLNIILHGLFGIVVTDRFRVITPYEDKHAYLYLNRVGQSMMSGGYSLLGVTPGLPAPSIDSDLNLVLKASDCGFDIKDVDKDKKSYCSLRLPFPSRVVPLRSVEVKRLKFGGDCSSAISAIKTPLVQALVYDVVDPTNLGLYAANAQRDSWRPPLGVEIVNLHIFAEPKCRVEATHASAAFNNLCKLIHDKIKNLTCVTDADPPSVDAITGVDDLLPEEELSLQERTDTKLCTSAPGVGGGIRIVNCMSLFIQ